MILKRNAITRKKLLWLGLTTLCLVIGAGSLYAAQNIQFVTQVVPDSPSDMEHAQVVAGKVFHKVNPDASVKRTSLVNLPDERQVWQVEFEDHGEVNIDPETEKVSFFYNGKRFKELSDSPSAGEKLTKEAALVKAKDLASDLGLELGDKQAIAELSIDRNGIQGRSTWDFTWPRENDGYKYRYDRTVLMIDAFRGDIVSYNQSWESGEPDSTEVSVSESEAKKTAIQTASTNGFGSDPSDGQLEIVNPNYRWTQNAVLEPQKEGRLAWVFNFQASDKWNTTAYSGEFGHSFRAIRTPSEQSGA